MAAALGQANLAGDTAAPLFTSKLESQQFEKGELMNRPTHNPKPKYAAKIPPSITTPDTVETRLGTLKFFDGLPDEETVKKVFDNLDFARGVEAFLIGIPATSVQALKNGFIEAGFPPNQGTGITESLADARTLYLTPNATVIYQWACADVSNGPMVIEVPPAVLGIINDAYFRFITDMGQYGPDQAKGGKFLLVPEGYTGGLPKEGYYSVKTRTRNNLVIIRAFVQNGDLAGTVKSVKAKTKIYPLSAAANPPAQKFVNISGMKFNTIHANNFKFYEELNEVVQYEPDNAFDPDTVGLFASIGIKKGKPFAPDARLKATLTDAVAVGNATSRAIVFASRDPACSTSSMRWAYATIPSSSSRAITATRRCSCIAVLPDSSKARTSRGWRPRCVRRALRAGRRRSRQGARATRSCISPTGSRRC
jgi:hypothetical protein